MATNRELYIKGLENYNDLLEANRNLNQIGELFAAEGSVAGNEGLLDAMADLGSGMFSVTKWMGGKTLSAFSSVLGAAGMALTKTFSDNKVLMERITQRLKADEHKEYAFSGANARLLTSKGDADTLSHDMDVLEHHLDLLVKHSTEVLNYLDKQLVAAKKLRNVSTTDDVFAAVDSFNDVKYPVFHLAHTKGTTQVSDVLPGGKTWEFEQDKDTVKYVIGGDLSTGTASSLSMDKASVSALLTKLSKINAMHSRLKDAYDGYLSFLRSWSEMVKAVEPSLSKLDKVSRTAIGQAEKILAGDTQALAFYSGFTPRVVSFTDRYIHGVLGVFA